MSQDRAHQADVVKRGILKYKASKVKGTSGSSAQGPKSSKSLYIVFRALDTGNKVLCLYTSDKKFHEAESPKWVVHLQDATSVYFLTDKKSFCVSMGDGGLLFLDSSSVEEAEEWVRCLNAVLYAKGLNGESTLQYEVTMMPTKLLAHSGPSILELRDHDLIVWKADTWDEMVRWQLNHLRSFKAKKHDLIIVSGKRSCTGLGEFIFRSKYSIQITYVIETIVEKVKYRSSPSPSPTPRPPDTIHSQPAKRSRSPTASLSSNIPDMMDPNYSHLSTGSSNSIRANIPSFAPPGVYAVPDEPFEQEDYGRLEHVSSSAVHPHTLGFEMAGNQAHYRKFDRSQSKSPHNSPPRLHVSSKITKTGATINSPMEEYRKLNRPPVKSPVNSLHVKDTSKSRYGYEDIDDDFEEYGKLDRSPPPTGASGSEKPPVLPPSRQSSEGYGRIDHHPRKPQPGQDLYESLEEGATGGAGGGGGGQPVVHPEEYNKISRNQHLQSPMQEEYGELNTNAAWKLRSNPRSLKSGHISGSSVHDEVDGHNVYGTLHDEDASKEKGNIRHTVHGKIQTRQGRGEGGSDNYGKLNHRSRNTEPENRSRVPKPNGSKPKLLSPQDDYGHLDRTLPVSHSNFDPYATLPVSGKDPESISMTSNSSLDSAFRNGNFMIEEESSTPIPISNSAIEDLTIAEQADSKKVAADGEDNDIIEEESSTAIPIYSVIHRPTVAAEKKTSSNDVNQQDQDRPPPGYDKLILPNQTVTHLAVNKGTNGLPPVAPPRVKSKHSYQNVNKDGRVLIDMAPGPDGDHSDSVSVENDSSSNGAKPSTTGIEGDLPSMDTTNGGEVVSSKPSTTPKPKPKPRLKMF